MLTRKSMLRSFVENMNDLMNVDQIGKENASSSVQGTKKDLGKEHA